MRLRRTLLCILTAALAIPACACFAQEDFTHLAMVEADYIVSCQYDNPADPAHGAINNLFGPPTWVVPRENAMAILGLLMAEELWPGNGYRQNAELAADYLARVQDKDGAWFNQYHYAVPGSDNPPADNEDKAKSPTQTAEVMIALAKLGFAQSRYQAMKRGAQYLMDCQKNGGNGFLLGGGKDGSGVYRDWRWASDNAYAYQALKAAEVWAVTAGEIKSALFFARSARKILKGIDTTLYINNPYDPDYGVWHRAVDEKDQPVDVMSHDWINYAPQMLDLPCRGVNNPRVGEWIHRTLQKEDGACVWDDNRFSGRRSPGYSFQAALCWRDLEQAQYYYPALQWALGSGLWRSASLDENNVRGGWVDWKADESDQASWWERFIDTSFYAIAAFNGGYDFSVVPGFIRIRYTNPAQSSGGGGCYLQLRFSIEKNNEDGN